MDFQTVIQDTLDSLPADLHERISNLEILVEEICRGVKITEPALDPAIADAAFKLWGWKEKD